MASMVLGPPSSQRKAAYVGDVRSFQNGGETPSEREERPRFLNDPQSLNHRSTFLDRNTTCRLPIISFKGVCVSP